MRDLFFLTCGGFKAPRGLVTPEPVWTPASERLALTVAVCVRDDGSLLLVDAGWSQAVCEDPKKALGHLRSSVMRLDVAPTDAVSLQLAALGFDPARVTTIVATHLHLDHVSGASDFPNAELITTSEELRAFSALTRDMGYRSRDLAGVDRLRVVRMRQGFKLGFHSSLDLFEDGEVTLLEAEGHTPGHLAVALRGPKALYVHVGDAVYQEWELGLSPAGPSRLARMLGIDQTGLRRTYARLRACRDDEALPILVPSHDQRVFEALPHRPAAAAAAA